MTKQIRSLSRAINVIEALSGSESALSLHQLHHLTQLDRATILRILTTLIDAGWVYRSLGDHCYRLTFQIHELGTHIRPQNDMAQLAAPILKDLQQEIFWPSDLAIYNGRSMEIIETTRRNSPLFLHHGFVGYTPYMLQSAVGRAYLAWSHPIDQKNILQRVHDSNCPDAALVKDEKWVRTMLENTRKKGYAERDRLYLGGPDDHDTDHVSAVAIPIIVKEEVQACLNLIWIEDLVQPEQIKNELLPKLRAAADSIATQLLEHDLY